MKHSGQLGYVLFPDSLTEKAATEMARDVPENRIAFGGANIPHLTLYHAKFRNVPDLQVQNFLFWLEEKLPLLVHYKNIEPFGGKFTFWTVKKSPELIDLHNAALFALSAFFDPNGSQQADTENIELSAEEQRNVRAHGHHSVGKLWKPHVTIGYAKSASNAFPAPANGLMVGGAFVEIGAFGMITRVIHQTKQ